MKATGLTFFIGLLAGLLGGLVGSALFHQLNSGFSPQIQISRGKIIKAQYFQVVDDSGKIKAQLGLNGEGQSGLMIFDNNEKPRFNVGLYEDQTAALVLNDKQGSAIQIMRAYGPAESPLHIFKTNGTDMMILGLNPSGKPNNPFLMYYDSARIKNLSFGTYGGP